jgi:hypothetical protein
VEHRHAVAAGRDTMTDWPVCTFAACTASSANLCQRSSRTPAVIVIAL